MHIYRVCRILNLPKNISTHCSIIYFMITIELRDKYLRVTNSLYVAIFFFFCLYDISLIIISNLAQIKELYT